MYFADKANKQEQFKNLAIAEMVAQWCTSQIVKRWIGSVFETIRGSVFEYGHELYIVIN